jgi:hypothetical protein
MFNPRLPHNVFVDEFIQPLLERATAALALAGPPLDPAAARLCIMSAVGQLLQAIKAYHLFACQDHPGAVPESLADYVSHFVRFSAGGIRACAGEAGSAPEDGA